MFQSAFINGIAKLYQWFVNVFSNLQSIFVFILRITWGHQFFLAGYGKLTHIDRIIQLFTNLNIPFPTFNAYLVGIVELVAGILLILGLMSRLSAFATTIIMLTAYSTAHVHIFTFHLIKDPSLIVREAPFPFLLTSLIVLIYGPGKIALDGWIKQWAKNRQNFYGP